MSIYLNYQDYKVTNSLATEKATKMRIPIKALKAFAQKYKLNFLVVFARDENGKNHHVATFGKTVEQCSLAADWGNKIKKSLDWPDSLQSQPSRVKKLHRQINNLKEESKLAWQELDKEKNSKQDGLNMCANKIHAQQQLINALAKYLSHHNDCPMTEPEFFGDVAEKFCPEWTGGDCPETFYDCWIKAFDCKRLSLVGTQNKFR